MKLCCIMVNLGPFIVQVCHFIVQSRSVCSPSVLHAIEDIHWPVVLEGLEGHCGCLGSQLFGLGDCFSQVSL